MAVSPTFPYCGERADHVEEGAAFRSTVVVVEAVGRRDFDQVFRIKPRYAVERRLSVLR